MQGNDLVRTAECFRGSSLSSGQSVFQLLQHSHSSRHEMDQQETCVTKSVTTTINVRKNETYEAWLENISQKDHHSARGFPFHGLTTQDLITNVMSITRINDFVYSFSKMSLRETCHLNQRRIRSGFWFLEKEKACGRTKRIHDWEILLDSRTFFSLSYSLAFSAEPETSDWFQRYSRGTSSWNPGISRCLSDR